MRVVAVLIIFSIWFVSYATLNENKQLCSDKYKKIWWMKHCLHYIYVHVK